MSFFEKKLSQSVTNREIFTNFKAFITKYDKKILQITTGITKCDNYYKVRLNTLVIKT